MGYWQTTGVGEYVALQGHSGIGKRLYKPAGTRRGMFFHSGNTGNYLDFLITPSAGANVTKPLADAGWPVISFTVASTDRYGNSTNTTRIDQLWSFMQTRFGVSSDQFYGVGSSKGCTGLLNYAKANPGKVAGLALLIPAVDIQDMYDNNRGGSGTADIAACYGGGRPPDSANPIKNTSDFVNIPIKVWYSDTDPVCIPSAALSFASAVGAETVDIGSVGHDATAVNPDQVSAFFEFLEHPRSYFGYRHHAGRGQ